MEKLCVLMTFPDQQPGDYLATRPESTATIVYLGAGLGQRLKKKFHPSLVMWLCTNSAFSERQFLPLQIENRFYLEAVVAVRADMISGMQPVHLVSGACELLIASSCSSGAPQEHIFRAGYILPRADPTSLGLGKPCLELTHPSLQPLGSTLR